MNTVRVHIRGLDAMMRENTLIRQRIAQPFKDPVTTRRVLDVYADHTTEMLGSRGRGSWPQLSPRYAAYKRQVRPGRPMMVFDGHLSRSLTDTQDRRFKVVQRPTRLTVSPDVKYAAYHQAGRGHLPRRRLIDLKPQDAKNIGQVIAHGLVRGLT